MDKRALLWTAPDRPTGEMYAQMLRERGLPVIASLSLTGTDMINPNTLTDLWLEDGSLLDDPANREIVDEVLPEYAGEARALPTDE
jgi:hypothetical protein